MDWKAKAVDKAGTKGVFVAGICSGIVLVANWRPLAKAGIKAGLRGARHVQMFSARSAENLSDIASEARQELAPPPG